MSKEIWKELGARFGERLLIDEPLSGYTTYRIGGPAAAVLFPHAAEEVAESLEFCRSSGLAWVVLGLGSNVLVSDSGFPGLVIRIGKGLDGVLDQGEDGNVWRVAAGMPTPRLARETAMAGLAGVHKLVGIPGTVGGGVATNAGANGQEFCQVVRSVEYVVQDGRMIEVTGDRVHWEYRRGLDGVVVTAVTFEFEAGDSEAQQQAIRSIQASRREQTPFDLPCCGSVFKNPGFSEPGQARDEDGKIPATAGQLIDAAGLKGFRVGAAEVSKMHANYIVNLGGATAVEVHSVIEAVRGRVFGEFGVELELEVRIIE
jgi:UDP-N-acetylmuramate dehydrogenase